MSEEGDDSPPRPKRKIKRVVVLSSSSDSDSEDTVGVASSRRKKLRIISDEEGNDSSGSSVVCAGTRRRRMLPKLKDSDAESDSSGWATEHSDPKKPTASTSKPTSGFTSDSSEGNSDKCSICLLRFTNQEVGIPENCEHIFCLDCILEWSKNVNTCPVDRIVFNSIVVKACAGGRVLRTQPVKVVERRPSVDLFVIEDPTVCEICGSTDGEETMLLCDSCDLGYHMQCLTPPLSEIPPNQWLCPNCYSDILDENEVLQDINLSEVEDLLDDMFDTNQPLGPRPSPMRQNRNVRRSSRNLNISEQPSTSSGRRGNNISNEVPTTSRGTRRQGGTQRNTSLSTTRHRETKRRKYKRRRAKTVIIEYEVQENGKFPITKKITRKVRKRRVKKRQPRTAARRSYVRASVRARLATLKTDQIHDIAQLSNGSVGVQELSVRRQRAGILPLSILGNPNELDYFSDEADAISEEASTAVALRPSANVFSAYRQARRKMIMIPSPPHASSAPDILSNILESQTLLHSKKSVMSIAVDGNVNIKLQTQKHAKGHKDSKKDEKVDLSKVSESVKKVPSYPGQNRGGGWGGGYRGNYHREQTNNFNRGGNYESGYSGSYQNRQGNSYNYQNNNNMRNDNTEYYDNFPRRPQQYSNNDDSYFDRSRRQAPDNNRVAGSIFSNHQRFNEQNQNRYSLGPSWQPYNSGGPSAPRQDNQLTQSRHSFGGFENPVDMRMGQMPPMSTNTDTFSVVEAPRQEKSQPQPYQSLPEPQAYQPLSEPPVFNFPKISEIEKSEDEKSDSGLVIDTEKYDPTEPTHDEDSGEEEAVFEPEITTDQLTVEEPQPEIPPSPLPVVQSILAGIDTSTMNVPPNILDTAVRQVLKEHRNLIAPPNVESHNDRSDDESDGDCPNFSIYSATSVHIANNSNSLTDDVPKEQTLDNLEDLVQEDDDTPPSSSPVVPDVELKNSTDKTPTKSIIPSSEYDEKKKFEEEYKEKVSKRCPITTNKRNPIKIKLNTPSLIKRQVTLYDEEDNSQDSESPEKVDPAPCIDEDKSIARDKISKQDDFQKSENINLLHNSSEADDVYKNEHKEKLNDEKDNIKEISEVKEDIDVEEPLKIEDDDKFEEEKLSLDKDEENNNESSENDLKNGSIPDHESADVLSDQDIFPDCLDQPSPKTDIVTEKTGENVEKMTESISETEDERSYTPCLDENKSNKDASFETEKDKGLEGLDTEMISEDEGNEMFSENERAPSENFGVAEPAVPADGEEGEIPDKKKEVKKSTEGGKKKKKKDSKKEGKEKTKSKKKGEISFKKLSKSGKERNYRERDKDDKKTDRERRNSGEAADSRQRRRKEKRKDLERYDVRTVVTEKRRKQKDAFGRDVSPRGHSPSLSPPPRSPSRRTPSRGRRSTSRPRRSLSRTRRSLSRNRRPPSKIRRSLSRNRRSPSRGRISPSRMRRSISRIRRSLSGFRRSTSELRQSISRVRRSSSRGRRSISKIRRSPSPPRRTPTRVRRGSFGRGSPTRRGSPGRVREPTPPRPRRRSASSPRRRSGTPQSSPRRRSAPRRKRRRSASRVARSPPRRAPKKKKRARAERRAPLVSPERKRRRSASRPAEPVPPSPASRPPSPRTPPPDPEPEPERRERRRRDPERPRRRGRDLVGPSKEVFTSGDNILVSVSFKEQERGEESERRRRRETRRERRRRRRVAGPAEETVKPVAIIDLERSPFRELTPSPKNVIVLSDSEPGEREGADAEPAPAAAEPAPEAPAPALGPKTPPEPAAEPAADASPAPEAAADGSGPPSPDAYDPFEPTRSPSPSPNAEAVAAAPSPPRTMTLEAAQRSNLSADEVLDRRPLTPVEKVMALLQSTRDAEAEGEPPEPPPAPRIVLPSPGRGAAKLFPGKPSPIKSNPVKPMQATRLPRAPSDGASPYSPGSSDFGELFEPPPRRARASRPAARVPVRLDRKRGKTQVGVKIDDDNLKILDELPSSAVELQVKSKFLKKLNRQERVVEEVKLVLKPHYNKKRVTKEEYKDILRRAVPKICHNKSGEINPTKIQALVEAYVKKFRKKHKLGVA